MLGRRRKREHDEAVTIDLSAHVPAPPPDPETAARERAEVDEFIARRRAEQARREAEAELRRLRQRHWTGERVLQEGYAGIEFWEHPEADPYAVLGLLPGATLEEAAARRREIARECHPDLGSDVVDVAAAERMAAANAAFERLRRAMRPVM